MRQGADKRIENTGKQTVIKTETESLQCPSTISNRIIKHSLPMKQKREKKDEKQKSIKRSIIRNPLDKRPEISAIVTLQKGEIQGVSQQRTYKKTSLFFNGKPYE